MYTSSYPDIAVQKNQKIKTDNVRKQDKYIPHMILDGRSSEVGLAYYSCVYTHETCTLSTLLTISSLRAQRLI
jgi:hypothetical protein